MGIHTCSSNANSGLESYLEILWREWNPIKMWGFLWCRSSPESKADIGNGLRAEITRQIQAAEEVVEGWHERLNSDILCKIAAGERSLMTWKELSVAQPRLVAWPLGSWSCHAVWEMTTLFNLHCYKWTLLHISLNGKHRMLEIKQDFVVWKY